MAEPTHAPAENPLSERELEVAQLLVTGASNAEIARDLVISPHTVKVHLRNIFEKLQVGSRTEASMLLMQRGWVIVPGVEFAASEPAALEPPPLPEPVALDDVPARMAPWQGVYLVAVLILSVALLALPNLIVLAQSPANLLTDVGRPASAPANIRLEPRWEMRTPLQAPRDRLAMTALDGRLYVVGGEDEAGEAVADALAYDLQTNGWGRIASLPVALANVAITSADGKVFVAGGSTNGGETDEKLAVVDTLYVYSPTRNLWSMATVLPYPVAGAALAADADALYLIGGWDGREMRDEIWRYPLRPGPGAQWQLAGHLSKARAFLGAVTVGGEIYMIGGYDGQRDLDLAEVFTPATGERRQLPALGTARGGLAVAYDGLAVYALGGGWTQPVTTHERYDPFTNAWSNFPSPVQGEWRNLTATAADGRLHLVGGWSGTVVDTHLEYQSSFRALLPVISNE
jgi:DNA-binding CsgD family transcriptional regulator